MVDIIKNFYKNSKDGIKGQKQVKAVTQQSIKVVGMAKVTNFMWLHFQWLSYLHHQKS